MSYTVRILVQKKPMRVIEDVKDILEGANGLLCIAMDNGNSLLIPMDGILEIEMVKINAIPKAKAKTPS